LRMVGFPLLVALTSTIKFSNKNLHRLPSRLQTSARTPLSTIAPGLADKDNPIKTDAVITADNLGEFATYCEKNSARIQDLFNMAINGDVRDKPMQQLGKVLARIGLSLQNSENKKIGKAKIRYYRIHPDRWRDAMHYLELRKHEKQSIPSLQLR
jgi:hypothetical protein